MGLPSKAPNRCPRANPPRRPRPPGPPRYLFAVPEFRNGGSYPEEQLPPRDRTLTLTGVDSPRSVVLLATGEPLEHAYSGNTLSVRLPAIRRTKLVDVVQVDLAGGRDKTP